MRVFWFRLGEVEIVILYVLKMAVVEEREKNGLWNSVGWKNF